MNTIQWTGNPFVDTGLAVLVARAQAEGLCVSVPGELTDDILRRVVGDGSWLAATNRRLKAYSLVLGSNSPLMNASTNPGLVLSNLKLKVAAGKRKIGEIERSIAGEQAGKNREKKLLQLRNQLEGATRLLLDLESKLARRSAKQAASKEEGSAPVADSGLQEYITVIQTLLEDAVTGKYSMDVPCECTGILPSTRALGVASALIRKSAQQKQILASAKQTVTGASSRERAPVARDDFVVGRDWFPLAGSIGNDAQALPAASRAPQLSALALLAVQFLPLGAMLLNGQLVLFQSTEQRIMQMLVNEIYRETQAKLDSGVDKVEIRGARAGTTPTASILLKQFERLQEHHRIDDLPPNTTLNLWLFSNSGTSASADVIEVPHPALEFLWEAAREHFDEMRRYLDNEAKMRPDFQLLTAIQRGREYAPFYPYKQQEPASIPLFELYNRRIVGRPVEVLRMAHWVAAMLHNATRAPAAPMDIKDLGKTMGDPQAMRGLRPRLKGMFAEWAERGEFTLEDYTLLFPSQRDDDGLPVHPLQPEMHGWRLIWFYLNHPSELEQATKLEHGIREGTLMFTHPRIKQFAADVFEFYMQHIGLEKFHQRILNGFRRNEISNSRLRGWFIDLAEHGYEGYSNEAWDDLCRDDNGNDATYEVRFQLRLELANRYAQALKAKSRQHV